MKWVSKLNIPSSIISGSNWENLKHIELQPTWVYWLIFYSFLIFRFYFTPPKAREISCKIWESRKIVAILHSATTITTTYMSYTITKNICHAMMYQINQEERIVNSYRSCTADLLACENMWLLYFFRFDVVVMLYLNKHACTKQLCSRNKSNGNNAALELCLDSND